MSVEYRTRFGSLESYEKGEVQAIADDVKNYAFSNCFDIAAKSRPWERVVFGKNQIYVLECVRAEGESPWYTCAHDEFAMVMDGEVEVHLVKLDGAQVIADAEANGAQLVSGLPLGKKMGYMRLRRGHQAMLPKNSAYQIRSSRPGVVIVQTCQGPLSIERWAEICQAS